MLSHLEMKAAHSGIFNTLNDTITVHLKKNHQYNAVFLTDASGKTIDEFSIPNGVEQIKIPTQQYHLPIGVYFVKIKYQNRVKTIKVFQIEDPNKNKQRVYPKNPRKKFPSYRKRSSNET